MLWKPHFQKNWNRTLWTNEGWNTPQNCIHETESFFLSAFQPWALGTQWAVEQETHVQRTAWLRVGAWRIIRVYTLGATTFFRPGKQSQHQNLNRNFVYAKVYQMRVQIWSIDGSEVTTHDMGMIYIYDAKMATQPSIPCNSCQSWQDKKRTVQKDMHAWLFFRAFHHGLDCPHCTWKQDRAPTWTRNCLCEKQETLYTHPSPCTAHRNFTHAFFPSKQKHSRLLAAIILASNKFVACKSNQNCWQTCKAGALKAGTFFPLQHSRLLAAIALPRVIC